MKQCKEQVENKEDGKESLPRGGKQALPKHWKQGKQLVLRVRKSIKNASEAQKDRSCAHLVMISLFHRDKEISINQSNNLILNNVLPNRTNLVG